MTCQSLNYSIEMDTNIHLIYQNSSDERLFYILKVTPHQAPCPTCSTMSSKSHSKYTRKIDDLPISGKYVSFHLITRKWSCNASNFPSKVFTERLTWMKPYGRK